MHIRSIAVPTLLLSLVVLAQVPAQGLTPADVARLRVVTGIHPSPDGSAVAFTRLAPRPLDSGPGANRNHLYLLDRDGERLLIGGKASARGVAWRPDGKAITFVRKGADDAHAEVWALPMNGGEAVRVTKTPRGVSSYEWAPDGKSIAYSARDERPKLRAKNRKRGFKQVVVDEDWVGATLYRYDVATGKSTPLTKGGVVNHFAFAPDGSKLAVGIAPRNLVDDRYMFTQLYTVDASGTSPGQRRLAANPGKLGAYAWSPDGSALAYVAGADKRDPHAGMLYVVAAGGGEPRALTPGLKGMIHDVTWPEAGSLVVSASVGVKTFLWRIDVATGERESLTAPGDVAFRTIARGGSRWFAIGSTASHPNEVFELVRADDGYRPERRTDSNRWLAEIRLGRQEVFSFKARDGLAIEGILMLPVDYAAGQRYPLVIVAHGGPEAHFSDGWNTDYGRWGQMLCARGYVTWYPNYRASTGYGVAFAKADHGDPMGREFEDHLDAIAALAKRGLIDPERVGLGGGSYGGYTAAWAATFHSRHFAAAVSFVPFTDIRTKWYTSDIPHEFHQVHYEEKWPHEQREFLAERSPLSHAERCRTPLLLCGGTSDPRVHPSQPFMLYRAVKFATETPVRYVQYPGEGHGNRTNVYRFDYCVRGIRWFDHYVKQRERRAAPLPPLDIDYDAWLKR